MKYMHIKYKGKRFHSSSIYFPTVKPSTRLINDGGNFSCLNTYIIIQCLLLMFLYVAARLRGREGGGGCCAGGRRNSYSEVVTTLSTQPQRSQCLTLSGATAATTN